MIHTQEIASMILIAQQNNWIIKLGWTHMISFSAILLNQGPLSNDIKLIALYPELFTTPLAWTDPQHKCKIDNISRAALLINKIISFSDLERIIFQWTWNCFFFFLFKSFCWHLQVQALHNKNKYYFSYWREQTRTI